MPDAVPLRVQLACARRALALRERVETRRVAHETMRPSTSTRARAARRAIVAAEGDVERQAEVCGGPCVRGEAEP